MFVKWNASTYFPLPGKFASTSEKRPFSTSAPSLAERPNLNERHNRHGGRIVVPRAWTWNARSIHNLFIYLSIYLSIHPSIHPSIHLPYLIQNLACHIKAALFRHTSTLPKIPHNPTPPCHTIQPPTRGIGRAANAPERTPPFRGNPRASKNFMLAQNYRERVGWKVRNYWTRVLENDEGNRICWGNSKPDESGSSFNHYDILLHPLFFKSYRSCYRTHPTPAGWRWRNPPFG